MDIQIALHLKQALLVLPILLTEGQIQVHRALA